MVREALCWRQNSATFTVPGKLHEAMSPRSSEWRMTVKPACSSLSARGLPMKPEAPVTSTVLFPKELSSILLKFVYSAFVIVRPTDVQPVAVMTFDMDGLAPSQHVPHQIVKSVLHIRRHVLQQ